MHIELQFCGFPPGRHILNQRMVENKRKPINSLRFSLHRNNSLNSFKIRLKCIMRLWWRHTTGFHCSWRSNWMFVNKRDTIKLYVYNCTFVWKSLTALFSASIQIEMVSDGSGGFAVTESTRVSLASSKINMNKRQANRERRVLTRVYVWPVGI